MRVHLDADVVLAVELRAEDRQVEGALQQLIPQIGDDLEVRVVLGAADVAVVLGTWTVVDLVAVAPIVAAQHEADGRVEVPLHFARIKPECQRSFGYSMPAPNALARSLTPGGPACSNHAVAARFWFPRNCDVARRESTPTVWLASTDRPCGHLVGCRSPPK